MKKLTYLMMMIVLCAPLIIGWSSPWRRDGKFNSVTVEAVGGEESEIILGNNTSWTPGGTECSVGFEGGEFKVSELGTELDVITDTERIIAVCYYKMNVEDSLSDSLMYLNTGGGKFYLPYGGSIVAWHAALNVSITQGTILVEPRIGLTETDIDISLSSGTDESYGTQASDTANSIFSAGDFIRVNVTTDDIEPNTMELALTLWIEF